MREAVPTATEPRRLGRRPVLDGMRGIAILLVMLSHTKLLVNGYIGVDLFFALSGFLITTLLYEEWDRSARISFRRFYARRARRLLPALVILVLAAVAVNFASYQLTGWPLSKKALTTLLFLNNWVSGLGHGSELGSLGPTWSLAQEEQFYLVWPLLLAVMLRGRFSPKVIAAILTLTIIGLVWWLSPHIASSVNGYSLYYSPVDRFAELLVGCLGAILWRHRLMPDLTRLPHAFGERVARMATRAEKPARIALCWLIAFLFYRLLFNYTLPVRDVYLYACVLGIVMIVNLMSLPDSLPARLIGCAPLLYLGRISYSLYLYHLVIFNLLNHYFPAASIDQIAVLTFAVSIPAAGLSWRFVESRILQLRNSPITSPLHAVRAQPHPDRPSWGREGNPSRSAA